MVLKSIVTKREGDANGFGFEYSGVGFYPTKKTARRIYSLALCGCISENCPYNRKNLVAL